jgi:hypothetical protein
MPAVAIANPIIRAHGLPAAGLIVGGACRRATLADGVQNVHSGAVEAVMLAMERPRRTADLRAVIKGFPHRWQPRPWPPRQRRCRISMHRQRSRELPVLPLSGLGQARGYKQVIRCAVDLGPVPAPGIERASLKRRPGRPLPPECGDGVIVGGGVSHQPVGQGEDPLRHTQGQRQAAAPGAEVRLGQPDRVVRLQPHIDQL